MGVEIFLINQSEGRKIFESAIQFKDSREINFIHPTWNFHFTLNNCISVKIKELDDFDEYLRTF